MSGVVDGCRLFKLPAELRNRIYRLTLVTSDEASPIQITKSGHERSRLLDTCKIIRSEALGIYYQENRFAIFIQDYGSSDMLKWFNMMKQLGHDTSKISVAIDIDWFGVSWRNLRQWLRRAHNRERVARPMSPERLLELCEGHPVIHLIGGMFATAVGMRGQPWSMVEPLLDIWRPSLVTTHAGWKED
ncbi:hypothetical protein PRZ48_012521 [Zasmidium cellare]|uniref:Uncharacterized protein n=1 Tax=Zasmidium cellare TaxID=395010 RepID=A0ABR0E5P1_ZASCE|nr:hypothetical protein PRZ48_012521 [Zasmidium cellare]